MSAELEEFLYRLADDANARAAFIRDPDAVLANMTLTSAELIAVKSRDVVLIREVLDLAPIVPIVVAHDG